MMEEFGGFNSMEEFKKALIDVMIKLNEQVEELLKLDMLRLDIDISEPSQQSEPKVSDRSDETEQKLKEYMKSENELLMAVVNDINFPPRFLKETGRYHKQIWHDMSIILDLTSQLLIELFLSDRIIKSVFHKIDVLNFAINAYGNQDTAEMCRKYLSVKLDEYEKLAVKTEQYRAASNILKFRKLYEGITK